METCKNDFITSEVPIIKEYMIINGVATIISPKSGTKEHLEINPRWWFFFFETSVCDLFKQAENYNAVKFCDIK